MSHGNKLYYIFELPSFHISQSRQEGITSNAIILMSPRNPQAFFGDDAEGLLHAADRACGHAEWPNSRPEGVPHGNQVQTRDPNDARGMAQASIPCCGQASLIPLPIILRQGSPLGCVVWLADIRSGDRNGRLAGFSPMYACHVSHCMYRCTWRVVVHIYWAELQQDIFNCTQRAAHSQLMRNTMVVR